MNNNIIISSAGTSGVCENWNNTNNNNTSMVSFVGGLRSSSYKQQFSDTSNNSNISVSLQGKTYITSGFSSCDNHPSSSIFDFSSLSTSLTSSPSNFLTSGIGNYHHHHHHVGSSSQFLDYPSTDFLKKEGHDDQSFMSSTSSISSSYLGGGNGGRIGLNLGHRTYFSSTETALIDRLFRRPRGFYQGNQVPRCQAEGCKMDLTNAKHYHRRHKVCELHSKATKVVAGGLEQRFCQQCSRFHVLAEFDQAKRSCRKRLADHNRRRRKTQPAASLSVTTPTAAISVKIAENAFPQAGPSASTSRPSELLKQPSMSSSTTTNNITVTSTRTSASTAALSLAGNHHHHHHHPMFQSPIHDHHQDHLVIRRPFMIFNNQQDLFVDRDSCSNNIAGNYHGNNSTLLNDEDAGSDQLTGGGRSEINQHPDELQKLLHLRQTMYEVELL